jgi:hypothetical protein
MLSLIVSFVILAASLESDMDPRMLSLIVILLSFYSSGLPSKILRVSQINSVRFFNIGFVCSHTSPENRNSALLECVHLL